MISFWWNTAKYFSSDMIFYPSKIEPNRKILSSKDAHGYCASFSFLIKKSTYIIKKESDARIVHTSGNIPANKVKIRLCKKHKKVPRKTCLCLNLLENEWKSISLKWHILTFAKLFESGLKTFKINQEQTFTSFKKYFKQNLRLAKNYWKNGANIIQQINNF